MAVGMTVGPAVAYGKLGSITGLCFSTFMYHILTQLAGYVCADVGTHVRVVVQAGGLCK